MSGSIRLRLPATSANLGSGFDTAAIALCMHLEIEAAASDRFSIEATGRDGTRCSQLENNLILETYKRVSQDNGKSVVPLAIKMRNGIPLGMGCGSSAAGIVAAVALAVHFGDLDWSSTQILEEACAIEGHPDNAAACWLGGFVATASEGRRVHAVRVAPPLGWRAILVLPQNPLATTEARALLPDRYSRADAIANIQAASLLGLAFAQGRPDLLGIAMKDRIHQPYRAAVCPMLPPLLTLADTAEICGVALSGSGPAVLVVLDREASIEHASQRIRAALRALPAPELLVCRFEPSGAHESFTMRNADRPQVDVAKSV
ncbi:MAG TPA: homoserine kinase [Terracidiphilus sp.]|nr:homoserine kinase [Terracidiphilus sp.]